MPGVPRGRCTIARMKLARLMVSDYTDNDLTRALVDVMREAKAAAG